MKKLLILIQSLLISGVVMTPTLFLDIQKEVLNQAQRVAESIDIVDLTLQDEWGTFVQVPNLVNLLNNEYENGQELKTIDFSMTNSKGETFNFNLSENDSEVIELRSLMKLKGINFETANLDILSSETLFNNINVVYLAADGAHHSIEIGKWVWAGLNKDAFLTKDVKFEYKIYF